MYQKCYYYLNTENCYSKMGIKQPQIIKTKRNKWVEKKNN